jgi:hypothetical protein
MHPTGCGVLHGCEPHKPGIKSSKSVASRVSFNTNKPTKRKTTMNALNEFNSITTPMLERHLAIKQILHYLHIQQSSASTGDKVEYRRATDIIDKLTTEYGIEAFHEARGELTIINQEHLVRSRKHLLAQAKERKAKQLIAKVKEQKAMQNKSDE